jgi:hypothetical protein
VTLSVTSTPPWKSADNYSACLYGTTALEMTGFFLEAVPGWNCSYWLSGSFPCLPY